MNLGGHFPPHGPPASFNTAVPPPGFMPPNSAAPPPRNFPGGSGLPPPRPDAMPPNLHPRLQLQMLLNIPLTGQRQPQPPLLLDAQQTGFRQPFQPSPNFPPHHYPTAQQQPFSNDNLSQSQPSFPGLLSGGLSGGNIPGIGDSQDLERLRALESAVKEVGRGTWQPAGVAPPPVVTPQALAAEQGDAMVARQAEAFIRELQSRGQLFDYKRNTASGPLHGRRRSLSSSSSGSDGGDYFGRRKRHRQDEDSDLEEGEVEDEPVVDNRYSTSMHGIPSNLPPPLLGGAPLMPPHAPSSSDFYAQQHYGHQGHHHLGPLIPGDDGRNIPVEPPRLDSPSMQRGGRSGRRKKGYHDLDAEQASDEEVNQTSSLAAQNAGDKTAAGKSSGGKNSFDSLFSAYLSAKKTTSKGDVDRPESPHPATGGDIAPLLTTLGPSLQQALTAVGIQVPKSLGTTPGQSSKTVTTAPSLSFALSAFDRDIAQLGGSSQEAFNRLSAAPAVSDQANNQQQQQLQRMLPTKAEDYFQEESTSYPGPAVGLPPSVSVEVAGDSSEWAKAAEEISSQIDKPGDQIGQTNISREMYPNRDNRAVSSAVQQLIPLIPMVERENIVARLMEKPDYTNVPMLLPSVIVADRVFPPLKDQSRKDHRRGQHFTRDAKVAPGWSKSELHDKMRQARERVNHLKIEQSMVEERLIVMGDELRKLHNYFDSNYGVKLVRPSDLEDPSELITLWKRREEEARKRTIVGDDAMSDGASAAVGIFGPELPGVGEDSNEQPDENGPGIVDASYGAAMEGDEDEEAVDSKIDDSSMRLLQDRPDGNHRFPQQPGHHHYHSGQQKSNNNNSNRNRHGGGHKGRQQHQRRHRGKQHGGGGRRGRRH